MKTKKLKSGEAKKLVLLDAHAIIHRAYHALPDFATSKGEPTGALYGLVTMLIRILNDLRPDFVIACFDLPGPTHRHEAYEHYKAGRAKAEEGLKVQLKKAQEVFKSLGIPVYASSGFEADDILGTIVKKLEKEDIDIIIASGDMDTLQLVDDKKVQVYTLKRGMSDTIVYDEKKVVARFGFKPKLLIDYKGLRGDPSDNIIGVKGVGEKTATSLITTYGTIENIYKSLKKDKEEVMKKSGISLRLADLLLENEEEAIFSKTLATIRTDAPISFSLPKPWRETLNLDNALELFKELEFRTLGERIKGLIKSSEESGNSHASPASGLRRDSNLPDFSDFAQDKETKELCLALWVIDSNLTNPDLEEVFRFTKTSDIESARKALEKELEARRVKKVFEDIEKPLIPIMDEMNKVGIKIDEKELKRLSKEYHKELDKLQNKIHEQAEEDLPAGQAGFNINSPKELSRILFSKLNLGAARQKRTPGGAISTKESELEKLKDKHPIIQNILDYRELQKLLSTYIDTIPKQLDKNSRLHSTFLQSGTTTGRLASKDPNLQNIPTKTELGRAIRHAFISEKGYKLVSLDYSQIELRIASILSGDKKLIEIFKNGEDVHGGVASRVFKVPIEKVDKRMRARAKVINFGILYGMGVNALKTNLETDRAEAQKFYNEYFETFTELAQYLEEVKKNAAKNGYTETFFGRRRYFAGFKSPLPYVRAQAERMAINAPIQGTQADIIKIAMKRIDNYLTDEGIKNDVRLLLQVHDELVYEIKEDLVEQVSKKLEEIMEGVLTLKETNGVPILADVHIADNWGEMK